MSIIRTWALHFFFILLIVISADRVLVTGLSDLYLDAFYAGDEAALDKALSWDSSNSEALYLKAEQQKDDQLPVLRKALFNNPADMRPLSLYAQILAGEQSSEQLANYLMQLASERMPADRSVRLQSAAHWINQENLARAVEEWRYALSIDVTLKDQLFPVFLKISASDQATVVLKPLTESPPDWWNDFIKYVASSASTDSPLVTLLQLRIQSAVSIGPEERKAIVSGLMRLESWDMAYLLWVDGLTSQQRQYLTGLYDGGFETSHLNSGFGWHLMPVKDITSRVKYLRKGDGQGLKFLTIKFKGAETPFKHVFQYTLLPPGSYDFDVQFRTGLLEGRGRLRWGVYCAGHTNKLIGSSELLLISKDWRKTGLSFKVPESGCKAQLVRLETVGKRAYDHKIKGSVWFDGLSIRGKQ